MIRIKTDNDWLAEQKALRANSIFLSSPRFDYTFAETDELVNRAITALLERGVEKNLRIAILSPNNIELLLVVFALWRLNCLPVLLNTRWTREEIEEITNNSGIDQTIMINTDPHLAGNLPEQSTELSIDEIIKSNGKEVKINFSLYNEALILYTSGSTSLPKGVIFSFNSLLQSAINVNSFVNHSDNDRWLASLPFYHIGGFSIIVRSLLFGCPIIIPENIKTTTLKKAFGNNISLASLVTTQLKELNDCGFKAPETIRQLFVGGGPVENDLIENSLELGWPLIKVYGSTETSSMVTANSVAENSSLFGSAGKPLGDVEIKINNTGEILIKSECLAVNYLTDNNKEPIADLEGYYNSGDVGFMESDYLYIKDRAKRIIISGGENISAGEVEDILKSFPGVADAYVYPEKEDKWGEIPIALLEVGENDSIGTEDVNRFVSTKLASYKRPKKYYIVKKIPRNELGKVIMKEVSKLVRKNDS